MSAEADADAQTLPPGMADHPAGHDLADLANVAIVPPIASAARRARAAMAGIAIDNVLAMLEGRPPPACVDPGVLA